MYGIDISPKMLELANNKIRKRLFTDRVKLACGDAINLPYPDNKFDAVFLSFTLELFDTCEIPKALKEVKRVLKLNGRLFLRLYEWAHIKFPKYIDCRPIFVTKSIKEAGFDIGYKKKAKIFIAPIEIVIGIKNTQI